MQITTDILKQLREQTGVSVMQCKKALEEAGGDIEKALIILKKQSSAAAAKKADRLANDGIVVVKHSGNKAVMLTLFCETDFVAKNDDFKNLADELATYALEHGVEQTKEIAPEKINLIIQKIGENIQLGNITLFEGDVIGSYVHNGKNAAIVVLEGGNVDLARDIAMHITAMKPAYVSASDISEEQKAKVLEVFDAEVRELDRPADIKQKMLEGKISTYFKEQTLVEQPFIKDGSKTVGQLLKENNAGVALFESYVF